MLQHNDIMELKQRLDIGTCAPPPKELFTHIKKLSVPPEIRKMRTGLELKPHEVDRIASPSSKKKLTKADLEWDEPLQSELTKEAGAALVEMVLTEDVTYPSIREPIGGRGRPELWGWWDRGKPASAVRLYSGHKLKEAWSKGKTHSYRLLLGKGRVAWD